MTHKVNVRDKTLNLLSVKLLKYSIIQNWEYPQLNIKSLKYPQAWLNLTKVNTTWVNLLKPPYSCSIETRSPINQNVDYITKIMKKTTQNQNYNKRQGLEIATKKKKELDSIRTFSFRLLFKRIDTQIVNL